MKRQLFSEEHEIFRSNFRQFVETRVLPKQAKWRAQGVVDREIWLEAGEAGFLCPWMGEEYGGAGGDFLHSVIVMEELSRAYESGWAASLHSDIIVPYIHAFGSPEQKAKWLPGCASGQTVTALAMTEPGTGSDLASIATTAKRDGDGYLINGAKTFISNGQNSDLVIVVAKTDPAQKHSGISLILVESDREGFARGRNLDKIGLKGQDTSELFFKDCRVPIENRLGEEGQGFKMLMEKLQQERLCIGIGSMASVRRSLDDTLAYVKERQAFGQPIGSFQNTQFKLAELETEYEIGRCFVDRLLAAHVRGDEIVKEVSMAKYWASDLQKKVAAECLQLFGGYGFMSEYPISQDYCDAAVQSIYAGTNEIMKIIIARKLGL